MGKLNQVLAVVAPKKKQAEAALTEAYHKIQKAELFNGISRVYTPKDEDGDRFPAESKNVQATCKSLIDGVRGALVEMLDVVATQDHANCTAKGDVTVDGQVILSQVPATNLLFLGHQLVDLHTFVNKLPTLDPADEWEYNENADSYASAPAETVKTKKVPRNHVKAEATDKHPAQVEVYTEDVVTGYWKTIKFSGAIPAKEKNAMLARVRKLQEAVLRAREEANNVDVTPIKVGDSILDYVFEF
jgi:hypothetical protein